MTLTLWHTLTRISACTERICTKVAFGLPTPLHTLTKLHVQPKGGGGAVEGDASSSKPTRRRATSDNKRGSIIARVMVSSIETLSLALVNTTVTLGPPTPLHHQTKPRAQPKGGGDANEVDNGYDANGNPVDFRRRPSGLGLRRPSLATSRVRKGSANEQSGNEVSVTLYREQHIALRTTTYYHVLHVLPCIPSVVSSRSYS